MKAKSILISPYNFIIAIIVFFYIYTIEFTFLPIHTARIISLIGIIYILYYCLDNDGNIPIEKKSFSIIYVFAFYLSYVAFITIIYNAQDITLLGLASLILLQSFVGAFFIGLLINKRFKTFESLIRILQFVIVIQGLFIVFNFMNIDIVNSLLEYIPGEDLRESRVRGLTHGTGAGLSALQGTGLFFTAYLGTKYHNKKDLIYFLLSVPVLLLSIMFTGNTGFMAIFVIIGYYILYSVYVKEVSRKMVVSVMFAPLILILAYFGFLKLYEYLGPVYMYFGADALEYAIVYVRREYFEFGDSIVPRTIRVLFARHWHLPSEVVTFLFGDPTTYRLNRISSDVGYVRRLYGVGVFGSVLFYIYFVAMLTYVIRRIKILNDKLLVVSFMIWLIIIEFKEPFMWDLRFVSIYSLMFFFIAINEYQAKKKSESHLSKDSIKILNLRDKLE